MKVSQRMKLSMKKIPPKEIARAQKALQEKGVEISVEALATYYQTTEGDMEKLLGIVGVFAAHNLPIDAQTATSISVVEKVESIEQKFSTEQGRVDWVQYWYEEHNPAASSVPGA